MSNFKTPLTPKANLPALVMPRQTRTALITIPNPPANPNDILDVEGNLLKDVEGNFILEA